MSKIYFTVGPSQVYPTVPAHARKAIDENIFSLNHRGSVFKEIYSSVDKNLKQLLSIPDDYRVYFLSSGTEAMERIIQNTVANKSFHVVSGTFGDRFYQTSKELGKHAEMQTISPSESFSASSITVPNDAELIAFTHNDTSTGMQLPMEEIYEVAKQNPEALVAIDCVSSMPFVDIDYTKVDCVFFSVQKGFGMPAGLGILVVSPRALQKSKMLESGGHSIGSYHSFAQLEKYAQKNQTPDTPNVFAIYLLERVLNDFLKIGIETIRAETKKKAQLLYDFFASSGKFVPLVKDEYCLSQTTLVVSVEGGSVELLQSLKENGFIVGSGYGERKNQDIRIANFPAHNISDVQGLIDQLKNV